MKYNELNSEATFDKYIREKEPELIPLLNRCKDQEKNSIKNRIRDQINGRLKKNKSKKKYYDDDDDDDDQITGQKNYEKKIKILFIKLIKN